MQTTHSPNLLNRAATHWWSIFSLPCSFSFRLTLPSLSARKRHQAGNPGAFARCDLQRSLSFPPLQAGSCGSDRPGSRLAAAVYCVVLHLGCVQSAPHGRFPKYGADSHLRMDWSDNRSVERCRVLSECFVWLVAGDCPPTSVIDFDLCVYIRNTEASKPGAPRSTISDMSM
jgi:hypothetical protein